MGHWESAGVPPDFDGIVRLFPLPNLVLFPHVIQALHIFEPRYCEMLSEALESDHLITMALLDPGWEPNYQGNPVLANAVCIGRIISHTPTNDGCHNILLAGVGRAKIIEELPVKTSFRQAKVELMADLQPQDTSHHDAMRANLLSVFRSLIPHDAANSKTFGDLLTHQLPLGILTDIVGYALSIPIPIKQALLSEPDVEARYHMLIDHIGQFAPHPAIEPIAAEPTSPPKASAAVLHPSLHPPFPPPFSSN